MSNTWLSDGDNLGVMRLLITTPTGNIGSRVLRELVELGTTSVRVIVRDHGKLPQSLRGSIDIVEGSHDDPNTIAKALEGVDAMFWCQPDSIIAEDYYGFYRRFASAGYEAIRRERTPRVVALSATGGAFEGKAGPITALREMEDILARSGAHVRFLRCGSFFENFLWQINSLRDEGTFYYPMAGDIRHPMVASDDIARTAVRWLTRNDWKGIDGIPVLGPADLSYFEVADILGKTLGRPIQFINLPPAEYQNSLFQIGYGKNAADALIAMFSAIAQGIAKSESRDALNTGSTTLESWAAKNLRPLASVASATP